jgi:hypothetical protein
MGIADEDRVGCPFEVERQIEKATTTEVARGGLLKVKESTKKRVSDRQSLLAGLISSRIHYRRNVGTSQRRLPRPRRESPETGFAFLSV